VRAVANTVMNFGFHKIDFSRSALLHGVSYSINGRGRRRSVNSETVDTVVILIDEYEFWCSKDGRCRSRVMAVSCYNAE
jgi:hypothetical protein